MSSLKDSKFIPLPEDAFPKHVAIVMDGNGRWAKERMLPRIEGHRRGVDRVFDVIETSHKVGLKALTLFAFSEENWQRPFEEVSTLMGFFKWYLQKEKKKILENNIRFKVVGSRTKLDSDLINLIEDLEFATSKNTGLRLNIALSYSSKQEITGAVKKLCENLLEKKITLSEINEQSISEHLQVEDVDLFIRTSGEFRISNFLLWQISYAELYFENCYWPDFTTDVFLKILRNFSERERRFGLISEQIAKFV